LHKSNKTTATDPQTGTTMRLFHPLEQRWTEHFTIDSEGSIIGLSSVGRATSAALRINDPLPRTARAIQLMLGLLNVLK
jgi:hypothetical protein